MRQSMYLAAYRVTGIWDIAQPFLSPSRYLTGLTGSRLPPNMVIAVLSTTFCLVFYVLYIDTYI